MDAKKDVDRTILEFDRGYIAKSPCKDCDRKWQLPECSKDCPLLSELQSLLVGSVVCTNKFSETDVYSFSTR
jgi:hypothetical protein